MGLLLHKPGTPEDPPNHVITGLVPLKSRYEERGASPYRDGRDKPGHDEKVLPMGVQRSRFLLFGPGMTRLE